MSGIPLFGPLTPAELIESNQLLRPYNRLSQMHPLQLLCYVLRHRKLSESVTCQEIVPPKGVGYPRIKAEIRRNLGSF